MDIVLGGRYTDNKGRVYSVLGLCGSLVNVMYADGDTALLSRAEHLSVLRNGERQQAIERRYRQHLAYVGDYEVDVFTAGYLAKHGYLYARMPVEYESTFVEDHVKVTGYRPDDEHYHTITRDDAWNALSTYVECSYNDDLDFEEVEFIEQPNHRWRVCSNRLFWALLFMGFKLGGKQDIALIRSRLTPSSHSEFDRGVN